MSTRSNSMDNTVLIAIVSGTVALLSAVGGGLIANIFARKKMSSESLKLEAEAEKALADANTTSSIAWKEYAMSIKNDLKCEIDKLKEIQDKQQAEINKLNKDNERLNQMTAYYLSGIRKLILQIKELEIEPVWEPREDERKE